jgi:mRNA interferase RelE/StbE
MVERNKAYVVMLSSSARKTLEHANPDMHDRLVKCMKSLETDPLAGKALRGDLKGYYSIHVWPFRIVYQIAGSLLTVYVISIGHRKDVYK